MKHVITSEKAYNKTLAEVYDLMNKGEANLTETELDKLESMAVAAEEYEDKLNIDPTFLNAIHKD